MLRDSKGRFVKGHKCVAGSEKGWFKQGSVPTNKDKKYPEYSGENSPSWKGGISKHSNGYILITNPKHPRADNRGYVPEHTLVMEKKIGRYLIKGEVVHHLDGIKNNNKIDNLYLFNNKCQHDKYHQMLRSLIREVIRDGSACT